MAFHHAGLGPGDRHAVEKGFLDGHINVICCTSTLAVGVNLPCHLVIIKNTVSWQEGGCQEYSDLEMMQMLGRAGRPQFDDKATAVILTRKERVNHYEKLIAGSESLESCLHLNLIEHLNAEIGLGNVTDLEKATRWLAGTFLFVRLRRNPTYYKLKEGASEEDEEELLRQVCEKDIKLLQECGLVGTDGLRSTQFGEAMARYYIRFETMKILLSLRPKATMSQIVCVSPDKHEVLLMKKSWESLFRGKSFMKSASRLARSLFIGKSTRIPVFDFQSRLRFLNRATRSPSCFKQNLAQSTFPVANSSRSTSSRSSRRNPWSSLMSID